MQSATNLVGMVKLAGSTRNERVAAVAGLAGGTAAVNTYNAAADLADTLKSGKGDLGCAGQAAAGAGDCGSAVLGAASAAVLNNLLSSGPTTATDKDGKSLTLEAQQARDHLVSTLVAAVATGAGLDAHAAVTSAQVETQNNSICYADGRCVARGRPTSQAEADKAWKEYFSSTPGKQALSAYGSAVQVKACVADSDAPGCAAGEAQLAELAGAKPIDASASDTGGGAAQKPGLGGPMVSLGVSASNGSYSGSETYNAETVLSARGTVTLLTPVALVLDGATVRGER